MKIEMLLASDDHDGSYENKKHIEPSESNSKEKMSIYFVLVMLTSLVHCFPLPFFNLIFNARISNAHKLFAMRFEHTIWKDFN